MKAFLTLSAILFCSFAFSQNLKPGYWYTYKGSIAQKPIVLYITANSQKMASMRIEWAGKMQSQHLTGNYLNGLTFANDSIRHSVVNFQDLYDTTSRVEGMFMEMDLNIDFAITKSHCYKSTYENRYSVAGTNEKQVEAFLKKLSEVFQNKTDIRSIVQFPFTYKQGSSVTVFQNLNDFQKVYTTEWLIAIQNQMKTQAVEIIPKPGVLMMNNGFMKLVVSKANGPIRIQEIQLP